MAKLWIDIRIQGLTDKYSNCCYNNEAKVHRVKALDTDWS